MGRYKGSKRKRENADYDALVKEYDNFFPQKYKTSGIKTSSNSFKQA